jgi:hypothetical protein
LAELYQRTGRQDQEVGILRVLIQQVGADGFRGFGLAALQKLLSLLVTLCYFMRNCSSPEFVITVP